jgi:outer membrane protein assembly factor BamB
VVFVISDGNDRPISPQIIGEFPLSLYWDAQLEGDIQALVAANNVNVVETSRNVFGVDASSGTILWEFVSPEIDEIIYPSSSLWIDENKLFIVTSSKLYCLELGTGNVIWKSDLVETSKKLVAVSQKHIFVSHASWAISAYLKDSGKLDWEKPQGRGFANVDLDPDQGVVYVINREILNAYDEMSGDVLWEQEIGSVILTAFQDGKLYYTGFENQKNHILAVFDTRSKNVVWSQRLGEDIQQLLVNPEGIFVVTEYFVTKYNIEGDYVWGSRLGYNFYRPPVLEGGVLYIRGQLTDMIYAVKESNGSLLGALRISEKQKSIANLEDDLIIGLSSRMGNLLIFAENEVLFTYGK